MDGMLVGEGGRGTGQCDGVVGGGVNCGRGRRGHCPSSTWLARIEHFAQSADPPSPLEILSEGKTSENFIFAEDDRR